MRLSAWTAGDSGEGTPTKGSRRPSFAEQQRGLGSQNGGLPSSQSVGSPGTPRTPSRLVASFFPRSALSAPLVVGRGAVFGEACLKPEAGPLRCQTAVVVRTGGEGWDGRFKG